MPFHQSPNTYVSHLNLRVHSLERSDDFYQNMLGLQLTINKDSSHSYSADGKTPLITLREEKEAPPHYSRSAGLYHVALLLPTRQDLAAIVYHLLRNDYPLQGGADHNVSEAVYLADPDGNGIELYRDRPAEEWEWTDGQVKMLTEELDANLLREIQSDQWHRIPEQTILGHLHLQVADLAAAERFYCEGLGFAKVAQYGQQASFLSTGGYHHHIGMNTWMSLGRAAMDARSYGMTDFTVTFPSEASRAQAVERLGKLGYAVQHQDTDYETLDSSNLHIKFAIK